MYVTQKGFLCAVYTYYVRIVCTQHTPKGVWCTYVCTYVRDYKPLRAYNRCEGGIEVDYKPLRAYNLSYFYLEMSELDVNLVVRQKICYFAAYLLDFEL